MKKIYENVLKNSHILSVGLKWHRQVTRPSQVVAVGLHYKQQCLAKQTEWFCYYECIAQLTIFNIS